jgi:hypothetical protein
MPRKNLMDTTKESKPTVNVSELSKIISSYIANKDLEKEYKDLASAENTRIKTIMEEMDISECEDAEGNNVAKVTEQKKETFIEERLIQFLKDNGYTKDIVKTKEYVDMDALESAIYHGIIPESVVKEMADCKEVKITKVLRVSKKKGEN